jgi:hypothetical protein
MLTLWRHIFFIGFISTLCLFIFSLSLILRLSFFNLNLSSFGQLFVLVLTLTYILMDNFCPCFYRILCILSYMIKLTLSNWYILCFSNNIISKKRLNNNKIYFTKEFYEKLPTFIYLKQINNLSNKVQMG